MAGDRAAARSTLSPLGVSLVVALGADDNTTTVRSRPALPFADDAFELVLNRHESFDAADVCRITKPGGRFVTQQVGSDEAASVRRLLDLGDLGPVWSLDVAVRQLQGVGWRMERVLEDHPPLRFSDIAALVAYVRSTPWAFPHLDWDVACGHLRRLHEQAPITPLEAMSHRFLVRCKKAG